MTVSSMTILAVLVVWSARLLNRTGIERERAEEELRKSQERNRAGNLVALMFLDLDGFKAVNDTLGHSCGDELLKEAARRMEGSVRKSDTVARLGGDEFAIMPEGLADARDVAPVARAILDIISQPFLLDGYKVSVTASIGIAVRLPTEEDRLLKDADAAMYRAKQRGRNNYEFYTEQMNVQASERLALERDLRRAQEREEFLLYYQPQVDLATGNIVRVEALLRWQHPEIGLVSPAKFIPVLEETGKIVEVGEWVLRTACRQGKAWQDSGLGSLRVAVNLSARWFGKDALINTLAGILEETGLDSESLELEITASLLMEDSGTSSRALIELKEIAGGIRVAIDDFGTGYSSLYRLKTFSIDVLKIDQSFVRDLATDSDDAEITAAMIGFAHNLRMKVVAEGVETEEQLAFLRAWGCDMAQGFYLGRPQPADELSGLLQEKREALPGAS